MYAMSKGSSYVWVMLKSRSTSASSFDVVFTRQDLKNFNSDIVSENIPVDNLFEYQSLEPIEQKYKANEVKLGEDELLETYRID